jgi:hypothetical protein
MGQDETDGESSQERLAAAPGGSISADPQRANYEGRDQYQSSVARQKRQFESVSDPMAFIEWFKPCGSGLRIDQFSVLQQLGAKEQKQWSCGADEKQRKSFQGREPLFWPDAVAR